MGTIVFDGFSQSDACYEKFSTDSSKKDECKVQVEIHEKGKDGSTERILLYRDKTSYLFTPEEAPKVPRLREMGFDDQTPRIRDTISMAVEMNYWTKSGLFDKTPSLKPALSAYTSKMVSFFAAGDLEAPDKIQRAATSAMITDLGPLSPEARESLLSLCENFKGSKWLPDAIRPRVEWLTFVLKLIRDVNKAAAPLKDDAEITKAFNALPIDLLSYVYSDPSKLNGIKTTLDDLQIKLSKNPKTPAELKDVFAFFVTKLDPMSKNSELGKDLEARQRYNALMGHLRLAVQEKRAELLTLDANAAFRRYVTNDLMDAAKISNLSTRVKAEMDAANLSPDWIKDNAKEIIAVVVPHLSLVQEKDKSYPLVKVDMAKLETDLQKMISKHGIQEREFKIGSLAVLRYLFGRDLNAMTMKGWVKNQAVDVEISYSNTDAPKLKALAKKMKGDISSSQVATDIVLPIGEGLLLAGGIGITVASHMTDYNKDWTQPLNVLGPSLIGLGTGALICHFAWKSRNPYLTDAACGVGGAGTGFAIGWATMRHAPMVTLPPPDKPKEDGRNPSRGYGP